MPTTPTLLIDHHDGFQDGMNVASPAHEISDTQAHYLQDVFIHQIGITDRRGPVEQVPGIVAITEKVAGMCQATAPDGTIRIGVITTDGTTLKLCILSADYSAITAITLGTTYPYDPAPIIDAKPMLNGGTVIGATTQDGILAASQLLVFWRGGGSANYSTGTITATYNSKAVTGSGTAWTTNLTPGMFLLDGSSQYIGIVQSITSNTALVLEEPTLINGAGMTYTAQAVRGFAPRAAEGFMTTSTSSTAVTGANTKFRDQGITAGWRIYKGSDSTFIGTVATVTNNLGLTLTANALIALQNEDYFAISNTANYSMSITDATKQKPGFLNTVYADRQWYANRGIAADAGGEWINRVWFSDPVDAESVDMSIQDGNFIPITSGTGSNTPIKALISAYNALVVLKEKESFIVVGQNPNQFESHKLIDDGCLSGMSAVAYNGGVIWAGRDGIYFYDGVNATNIVEDTLGQYYKETVAGFSPSTYRMWGAIVRDHYFLHIQRVTPPVPVIKGAVSATPIEYTIVIYMPRQAVVTMTNLNFRGYTVLSATTGQNVWYGINDYAHGYICSFDALFDSDGNDALASDGALSGPDFYIESKKFSAGNGLQKKLWKQLMLHYLVGGDALRLDTVVGLNTIGSTTTSTWGITVFWWDKLATQFSNWDNLAASFPTWDSLIKSVFFIKRIKFIKRSQYLAFRLYQNSGAVNTATIGPFGLGFKWQRAGRI